MSAIRIAISNAISCRQIAKDPQTNASLSKKQDRFQQQRNNQ
jgi:hypothetical protein